MKYTKTIKITPYIKKQLLKMGLLGLVFFMATGCRSPKVKDGEPLERVSRWNKNPKFNEYNTTLLHAWLSSDTPVSVVHTPNDLMPNGFARCMTPFLVDWKDSTIKDTKGGYLIVRNVLVGGNPILGIARHACIRIPSSGVERVELIIVRYGLSGFKKYSGHVQLRFIFREDRRPILLDNQGKPDLEYPYIDDLILSWEAWRAPMVPYNVIDGLKPEGGYALTARLYTGAERFLNDSLRGAVWDCYPLNLPDKDKTGNIILYAGLVMGDALGRRSILNIENKLSANKTKKTEWNEKDLDKVRGILNWDEIPDSMLKEALKKSDLSYNTFNRSCISLTLKQIDVAMKHLYAEKKIDKQILIKESPGEIPIWFNEVLNKNRWKSITTAPGAFFWILHNSEVLPYKAYLPLQKAGLLKLNKKGKPIIYRYDHKKTTPYGTIRRNLM